MSEHTCGCGCCGDGGGDCCHAAPETRSPVRLSAAQKEFLVELATQGYLPLARFVRTGTTSDEVYLVSLAPVYMATAADSMETVKAFGAFLLELEAAGLIALDYGEELTDYAYLEYTSSALFAFFAQTVREGARTNADFVGDTPYLERGSIALTDLGARSLAIS